ncbi:CopG family transcriptional regulator [[Haemophilus] ducreyi]|uniref:CopG family transcriptional regulator n=1 Tax=Haemophilus ducreyi TaxID=730 RepID=A0AAC8UB61_HAEDC|nr:CopG family transcriptional regulator [[Haemophilus] ducreyi]AKO30316.1 CopG family transcriptional regulator [[Haemophilus] ducreyi]AKO31749.1 CopG family transcriptional regulator [[Haemophilus] ducreyi]AKO33203.1 CopG family transcriptional regulator [[Haemophilus] ducreyi]AKO34651.1 CopG family transcriptional regulator [[Haemophilus] ducreyi]AKO36082.1 CopG family transcriptional regulator [[Haemophilus] ducreyi]
MIYSKLSADRKKAINNNSNRYATENYKTITLKLKPDLADDLDSICATESISRPELIKKMVGIYKSLQK